MINTHSCGAKWTGNAACHCAGCHKTFVNLTNFDMHRQWNDGKRECKDVSEWDKIEKKHGTLYARPGHKKRSEKLQKKFGG